MMNDRRVGAKAYLDGLHHCYTRGITDYSDHAPIMAAGPTVKPAKPTGIAANVSRSYHERVETTRPNGFSCIVSAALLLCLAGTSIAADQATKKAYDFAAGTLEYVETSAKRPKLSARLKSLGSRVEKAPGDASLKSEILALRREIILSHPTLAFEALLINRRPISAVRNHMVDHYLGRFSRQGDGLVILRNWKTSPQQVFVTKDRLPPGTITHPDLSFDAKKVVFAFCDHRQSDVRKRAFHLYEISLDSSGLSRLTGDGRDPMQGRLGRMTQIIEDFDPCYLPDGGLAFTSTRTMATVRCANYTRYNPAFVLHRCEGDGSKIRALSFGELNEYEPALQPDGRLIYTRWEYINRNITTVHGLWTTNPDGTGVAHFYGNNTIDPNVVVEARAIPGSRKVVASAVAHHRYFCGTVIVIDPEKGDDGLKPLTRVTPEVDFPEQYARRYMGKPLKPDANGIYPYGLPYSLADKTLSASPPHQPQKAPGPYAMPFPLSEELFLVARMEKKTGKFAIYLIDTLGGRELIFSDPKSSCWAPIPIRPRKRPPVRASLVSSDPSVKYGTFFIQDVYQNRFDTTGEIKRGSVKAVRIIQLLDQPAERAIPRGRVLFELPKRILGTVPVDANGSVAFRAPAGVPMQLQLIDKNAMAVMTMRSFIYLHPGETASCVGCHEPKTTAPPRTRRGKAPIHDITPPPWRTYEKGMSYSRTIQPVLDRFCIRCHGLDADKKNPMSLIATPLTKTYKQTGISTDWPNRITVPATRGYLNLLARPGAVAIAQAYNENLTSKPKDYFAHAGKLAGMLIASHPDKKGKNGKKRVRLDPASLRRIIDWLDLNAPFAGVYSFNRPENRTIDPAGEKALREHVKKTFGENQKLSSQPIAALVNVAEPDASRILLAPLAKSAGGWSQTDRTWTSTDAPGYKTMKKLVYGAIAFGKYKDIAGTCGRGSKNKCLCKACWIREAMTSKEAGRRFTRPHR